MTAQVFLAHQLEALANLYDVTLVANLQGTTDLRSWLPETISIIDVPTQRTITPLSDIRCYFRLKRLFKKNKYDIVHSVSPKAGLLSMLAARRDKVPIRIHTFTGQVWATKKGLKRALLRYIDRVTASSTTISLVDSHSQQSFLLKHNIVSESNSMVLCDGSISGVDCERFKVNEKSRNEIRTKLDTSDGTVVMLFVGRLKKEKGVVELIEAFNQSEVIYPGMELWLVGPDEEGIEKKTEKNAKIKCVPFTKNPEEYMASADILCLPSYREGFGSVVIEAAACEIPSIGTNIYGLQDAIVDNETGILVQPRSADALADAMLQLAQDEPLRKQMGKSARNRVVDLFSQDRLTAEIISLYNDLLSLPDS